jgi:hypothetical protein
MFTIQGKVVAKESGAGVGGLVVHAFDLDVATPNDGKARNAKTATELSFDRSGRFDSLGSVLTAADGSFAIRFEEADFNVSSREARPEILLLVTRPEDAGDKATSLSDRALHVSTPIRYKAARTESYHIRLRQADLDKHGIRVAAPVTPPANEAQGEAVMREFAQTSAGNKAMATAKTGIQRKVTEQVERDFTGFTLSSVSEAVRATPNYLVPGQDLVAKQTQLVDQRLDTLRSRPVDKRLVLRLTESQLRNLGLWRDGVPVESGSAPRDLIDNTLAGMTAAERAAIHLCRAEFTEADLDEPDVPPAPPQVPSGTSPDVSPAIAAKVGQQLATSTSPETALRYGEVIDPSVKAADVCGTVGGLSLCGGPADVTSYHDFPALHIAFEHVWTELFDQDLINRGKELYAEIVRYAEGYSASQEGSVRTRPDAPAATPQFMGSITFPLGGDWTWLVNLASRPITRVDDLSKLVADFAPAAASNPYVSNLVRELEERLSSRYKFDVFAPNSINYGVVYTFRQKWEPANYQVGRLVSSLPLAPREARRYSTKLVTKQSRNEKYLDDREFRGKSEQTSTSRAESEIIKRATNTTSFGVNTNASVNMEMFTAGVQTNMTASSERFSQDTKRNFREAVLNSVDEYRKQNKTEVEFASGSESTSETSGEISNPNDEITVTYLFYELQRQYDISEELHRVQPVVLVANEVPRPDEIDDDWIMAHAWILRRVILDESFLPAIARITTSSIGDNLALNNLRTALDEQRRLVSATTEQIEAKNAFVNHLFSVLQGITVGEETMETAGEIVDMVRGFVDPIGSLLGGLGGGGASETPTFDRMKDLLQMAIERADKEQAALSAQLAREQSYLQQLTERNNKELREFFDRQAANAQLRMHLKDNILYYMQAIWDYEPLDQRYFRLYNLEIDWFEPAERPASVTLRLRRPTPGPGGFYEYEVPVTPAIRRLPAAAKRKLVEVADLDRLIGYKGNYMVFPVREPNYLHQFMMQEFVDNATGGLRDADDFANYDTQDLIDYLKCLRRENPDAYARERDGVLTLINQRLQSPRRERERIVIPTSSLYIEALPGKHPVMEDFKLAHRALDVKKVQAEVRAQELENLRLAARLLEGERDDPNVNTRIEVTGNVPVVPVER